MKILPNGIAVLENDTHLSRWTEEQGKLDTDPTVRARICPLLKHGDTVIDCGAALGDHTVCYADAVGVSGHVIAIEANPAQFECLAYNTRSLARVTCLNIAVGSHRGFVEMVPNANVGASHVVPASSGIKLQTIDDLALERCDFIKLDIEGYELFALHGAIHTIKRFRPKLLIEMHRGHMTRLGLTYGDMNNFLKAFRYNYRPLCPESSNLHSDQYDLLAELSA